MAIKILSVDDELDLEILLTQYFRRKIKKGEYEFYFAHNGLEALQMMLAMPDFDVILSDINMPEMDGRTFLKQLKASSTFNFIPVIILSSLESSNDRIELLEAGASDFVLKPFNPQELKIRVRNLLR